MAIKFTDEQLGQKLCEILLSCRRPPDPRPEKRPFVIQRDFEDTEITNVVLITDNFFDLPKAAKEFADLVRRISPPPRKKAGRG